VIQTIPLGQVLQETVVTPYRDLVTRPTGAAVRGWIQNAIAQSTAPTTLLDFTGVGLLDFSCADEIVAKLKSRRPTPVKSSRVVGAADWAIAFWIQPRTAAPVGRVTRSR